MGKHLNKEIVQNMQVSLWINIKQRNSTKYVGVIMDKHSTKYGGVKEINKEIQNMQVSLWINIKQRNSTKYVGAIMDKHLS